MENVPCSSTKWSYWQAAVIQQEGEQFKHVAGGARLCHTHSQSDLRDPVQDRVQLGVTYEVSGDNGELGLHV